MSPRVLALIALVAAAFALGCGSDDEDSERAAGDETGTVAVGEPVPGKEGSKKPDEEADKPAAAGTGKKAKKNKRKRDRTNSSPADACPPGVMREDKKNRECPKGGIAPKPAEGPAPGLGKPDRFTFSRYPPKSRSLGPEDLEWLELGRTTLAEVRERLPKAFGQKRIDGQLCMRWGALHSQNRRIVASQRWQLCFNGKERLISRASISVDADKVEDQ